MSNDKMREEFEAWASTHFFLQEEDTIVDDSDEYTSGDMQLAWEAYQAGRAAPVVELPFEFVNGTMRADHVIDALEAAGVRVKS